MKNIKSKIDIIEILPYLSIMFCTFFTGGALWHGFILSLLLLIPYIIKHRTDISKSAMHIFPAVLLITGFIAVSVTSGDKQNSLYTYEKILCLIFAFYTSLAAKDENEILKYITAASVMIAAVGLCAYCNFIRFEDLTFNDRYILRLQSLIKYANTTALILGCGYFSVTALYDVYRKKFIGYFASGILIAFYLTVSKAAIPVFLVLGTVLFLTQRKYTRFFILQNLICMLFTILILLAGLRHLQTVKFLLIAVCILMGGLSVNTDNQKSVVDDKHLIVVWFIGFVVFFAAIIGVLLFKKVNIFETLLKRFDYMKDALTLLKEHWFIGTGPGAWKYYQYIVQTKQYDVKYIHNSFLQIWLEYGIVFFLTLLAVSVRSVITFIKQKQYVLCAIILFIITHSLIDIDLSFGLSLMILGLLFGSALKSDKELKLSKPLFIVTFLICCLISGYMVCEYGVRSRFENNYSHGKKEKAAEYALMLEKICPYDSNLQISLAALGQGDTAIRIERATELSPLDIKFCQTDIEYSISQMQPQIFEKCKKFIKMAPKQEGTYTKAKEYADKIFEKGLCTEAEYEEYLLYIDNEREKEGAIDRNKLLQEISQKHERSDFNE